MTWDVEHLERGVGGVTSLYLQHLGPHFGGSDFGLEHLETCVSGARTRSATSGHVHQWDMEHLDMCTNG